MGGFFGGFAGAIGDHLHEQHIQNLNNQVEAKRNLLDNYKTLLNDPHMEDVHDQIIQTLLKASSTDPTKLHKQIGKPGGEFDPTQWQVLAQQRHSGQAPSPVNQGQNTTQIPAAPPGHEQAPGGQAQTAEPFRLSRAIQQQEQYKNDPNTPANAAPIPLRELIDRNGMSVPPPPGVQPSPQAASQASQAGNMQAQALQALPPVQGSPVPNGVEVASPMQAAAIAPPPAANWGDSHNAMGGLTPTTLAQRQLQRETAKYGAQYGAQSQAKIAETQAERDQDIATAHSIGIDFNDPKTQTPEKMQLLAGLTGNRIPYIRPPVESDHVAPGTFVKQPDGTWKQVGAAAPNEAAQKDQQIFSDLADLIGKDAGELTNAEKQAARRLAKSSGDDAVGSALRDATSTKGAVLTPAEENKVITQVKKAQAEMSRSVIVNNPTAKEGESGTWSIQEDAKGNPIEYNSKTGEVRPVAAGGIQKAGTKEKRDLTQEKEAGPTRNALQYAQNYAKLPPTGPGDEALMEKFFDLAKPSAGFRMTQAQTDMLKNAQSWINSLKAKTYHAATGTWFSDKLRKDIVNTMQVLADSKIKTQSATSATSIPAPPGAGSSSILNDLIKEHLSK